MIDEEINNILTERENAYGNSATMLQKISLAWTAYLSTPITPEQAATMLALFKIMRSTHGNNPKTLDDKLDTIGYMKLAIENV